MGDITKRLCPLSVILSCTYALFFKAKTHI